LPLKKEMSGGCDRAVAGLLAWVTGFGFRVRWSGLEAGDLGEVVAEDAVAAPGSGSLDPVEAGSCPPVLTFQRRDPSLDAGPPPDQLTEVFFLLARFAFLAGFARAGYRNDTDTRAPSSLSTVAFP
jgi:hypothetical protein